MSERGLAPAGRAAAATHTTPVLGSHVCPYRHYRAGAEIQIPRRSFITGDFNANRVVAWRGLSASINLSHPPPLSSSPAAAAAGQRARPRGRRGSARRQGLARNRYARLHFILFYFHAGSLKTTWGRAINFPALISAGAVCCGVLRGPPERASTEEEGEGASPLLSRGWA